jgi:hypothetical protein
MGTGEWALTRRELTVLGKTEREMGRTLKWLDVISP